jgi:hypothetical protein
LVQASTIGRASGVSFGSEFSTMLPPVLASIALMSAIPFSLLPSETSVTCSSPANLAKASAPVFQTA